MGKTMKGLPSVFKILILIQFSDLKKEWLVGSSRLDAANAAQK
jgi:hypothetical protein